MNGQNPQQMRSGQASSRWAISGLDRSEAWTPIKTAQGRAEISRRSRTLNQRLRTVLLLIDGRRTISQIRTVAVQVGAPETCLDDLLDMGLVALPDTAFSTFGTTPITGAAMPAITPETTTVVDAAPSPEAAAPVEPAPAGHAPQINESAREPADPIGPSAAPIPQALLDEGWAQPDTMPLEPYHEDPGHDLTAAARDDASPSQPEHGAESSGKRLTSELFDELVRATPRRDAGPSTIDSTLRSSTSSRFDSVMSSLYPLLESAFGNSRIPNADRPQDDALEEARRILMREVRAKAPVTGALTLVKLRRASTREELSALFDEVGSHISLPMRRLSTQQILLHVKSLLERPM